METETYADKRKNGLNIKLQSQPSGIRTKTVPRKTTFFLAMSVFLMLLSSGSVLSMLNHSDSIGMWRFEEGTGNMVYDTSPNQNHGNIINAAWSSSKGSNNTGNYSLFFNPDSGIDTIKVIDTDNDYGFGDGAVDSAFSVGGWINFNVSNFKICAKKEGSGYPFSEWAFQTDTSDRLRLLLYDASESAYIGKQSPNLTAYKDQWIHVAATYNGTKWGGMRLYVNGIELISSNNTNANYVAMENTGINLEIGTVANGTSGSRGYIDELFIVDRELSESEITDIYNTGFRYEYGLNKSDITAPSNNSLINNIVNITWTPTVRSDLIPDDFTYTLGLYDAFESFISNLTILYDITSYLLNTSVLSDNEYNFIITSNNSEKSISSGFISVIIDNTAPIITITYPDHPLNWSAGNITGSCSDVHPATFSYNSSWNFMLINDSFNAWKVMYDDIVSDENVNITFTCTDNAGNAYSVTGFYNFDIQFPLCYENSIEIQDNELFLEYGANHQWNVTCWDDLNFYLLNITCIGGSGYAFYENNINKTGYNFSDYSGILTSDMICSWQSADGHTKNDVRNELNRWSVSKKPDGSINVPGKNNIIVPVSGDILDNNNLLPVEKIKNLNSHDYDLDNTFISFDHSDRIGFKYIYIDNKPSEIKEYAFYVNADHEIQYIGSTDIYKAWFVIDNYYWIDFNLNNDDGSTTWHIDRINDTSYAVSIETKLSELDFGSIGIINTNTQVQKIYISPHSALSADATLFTGICPENLNQVLLLWLIGAIAAFFVILMFVTGWGIFGIFASTSFFYISWTMVGCSALIGTQMALFGIVMLILSALLYRAAGKNDVFA